MSSRLKISRRLNWWGNLLCRRAGWTSCKWSCYCDVKLAAEPSLVDAELDWQENSGQLIVWHGITAIRCSICRGKLLVNNDRKRWSLELAVCRFSFEWPMGVKVDNWQAGLENALVSGRLVC